MVSVGEFAGSEGSRRDCHRCQSEVEHLDHALRRDHDVGGLQVAMNDAFFVRRFERVGDLLGVVQRGLQAEAVL